MTWSDWASFLSMGGHGTYVWAAVVVLVVMMGAELALLRLRESDDRSRGLFDESRESP